MKIITYNKERCSYKCPYYQNGVVLDLCNKYNEVLVNDGKAPPSIRPKCKQELADKKDQKK